MYFGDSPSPNVIIAKILVARVMITLLRAQSKKRTMKDYF